MTHESLGLLEIIASARGAGPGDAKATEILAIDYLDRVLAAGFERRIIEYPEIALELVGGMHAIRKAPTGLAFIDQRFIVTSHSGIPLSRSEQGSSALSSRIYVELDDPDGGLPITISLEDIILRSGSTIRSGSLRFKTTYIQPPLSSLAKVSSFLLGVIVTTIIQGAATSPISVSVYDWLFDGARAEIVERDAKFSDSPCSLKLSYHPNVSLMRQGIAATYDYTATEDGIEKRLRICNIQVALKVLGYKALGEIDGEFGPKTEAAWNLFREKQGLKGSVDDRDYIELAEAFRARVEKRLSDPNFTTRD